MNDSTSKSDPPRDSSRSDKAKAKEIEGFKQSNLAGQKIMGTLLPTLQPTIIPTLVTTTLSGGGYTNTATVISTNIPIVTQVYRAGAARTKAKARRRQASRRKR